MSLPPRKKLTLGRRGLQAAFDKKRTDFREARELGKLFSRRLVGLDLRKPRETTYYLMSRRAEKLTSAARAAARAGFKVSKLSSKKDSSGTAYYSMSISKVINLMSLEVVFDVSRTAERLKIKHDLKDSGWNIK